MIRKAAQRTALSNWKVAAPTLLMRAFLFCFLLWALDCTVELGTPVWLLSLSSIVGLIAGYRASISTVRARGVLTALIITLCFLWTFLSLFERISFADMGNVFFSVTLGEHMRAMAYTAVIAFISTWALFRYTSMITLELVALLSLAVTVFSPHRNLHLEMPKFLNTLAWRLGIQSLGTLVILSCAIVVIALFYIGFGFPRQVRFSENHRRRYIALSWLALVLLVMGSISYGVYGYYATLVNGPGGDGVLSNGVGQSGSQQGMSPLGFHSALGGTNQPAALVRLESDYTENPWSPMLYMRETALSEFSGNEMVLAAPEYDTDISRTSPNENFSREPDFNPNGRKEVTQSVFLLADQKVAFGIDYPISFRTMKNPNPERFRSTYRVTSLAPLYSIKNLSDYEVGDPRWSETEKQHYLTTHPDPRYANLAQDLTRESKTPMQKVLAITDYLSQTSIYTLTPNHEIDPQGDPVIPFLFGDHRGYCVHFAHATTYMLRSLGIPARIATGYLTDLSQSKDGHILLRMSDRHAWAEVYVRDIGWVPFDTQPQQVESHADTQVDMGLLEELMGLVQPGEDILPDSALDNETNVEPPSPFPLPDRRFAIGALASFLLVLIALKLYLWYGWTLSSGRNRLRALYRSLISQLSDHGFVRDYGETRLEFSQRVAKDLPHGLRLAEPFVSSVYDAREKVLGNDLTQWKANDFGNFKTLSFWRKIKALFSIKSIILFFRGVLTSLSLVFILANHSIISEAHADARSLTDLLDGLDITLPDSKDDDKKSADELIKEAVILFQTENEHLLEGRTKLLRALSKDPKNSRAMAMLANYYLVHVGHFRLALKYTNQAINLFYEKYGKPPYQDFETQNLHSMLLYILAQTRLNLDNYPGALQVLDEYTQDGYFGDWYPGTRAWVLMKLGKIKEAISVARIGVLSGAEAGRTLNMLGILLSLDRQPEYALQIFREAISQELSLGKEGQPATPLNNSGEVYNELFQDERAENNWLRAIRLPDGCEHVLPSLNLALLYLSHLRTRDAARSINDFEGCVAQYTLRNGEEHVALVHLARGRIALSEGRIDEAIQLFESASEGIQWFGKIGTSQDDLEAAVTTSLAQALRVKNNHLLLEPSPSIWSTVSDIPKIVSNEIRARWLLRSARRLLSVKLNNFEDIRIRNTDSLLDYATLGDVLEGFPTAILKKRLEQELDDDRRPEAQPYYKLYLAQSMRGTLSRADALSLFTWASEHSRPKLDEALRLKTDLLQLSLFSPESNEYSKIAATIYQKSKAALLNAGFRLPVRFSPEGNQMINALQNSPFLLDNSRNLPYSIEASRNGEDYVLSFSSTSWTGGKVVVKGKDPSTVVKIFIDAVFVEKPLKAT